jgi:hypothetical protein
MRLHWRRYLAGLITAATIGLTAGPMAGLGGGTAVAFPLCPAGTHWDHVLHICQ